MEIAQSNRTIGRSSHPLVRGFQVVYVVIVWLFALGIAVQVYLAGLFLFWNGSWLEVHRGLGWFLGSSALLMLPLVALARFPRGIVLFNAVLFLDSLLQVSLPGLPWPWLAALHPANALALFLLAVLLASRAQHWVRKTGRN